MDDDLIAEVEESIDFPIEFGDAFFVDGDLNATGLVLDEHEDEFSEVFSEGDATCDFDDGATVVAVGFGLVQRAGAGDGDEAIGAFSEGIDVDESEFFEFCASFGFELVGLVGHGRWSMVGLMGSLDEVWTGEPGVGFFSLTDDEPMIGT